MRISVFGLGYVGLVTALCHAADGHQVWGVDNDPIKLDRLRNGIPPIREPGIDALLGQALESHALTVSSDANEAVVATSIALICVGTPSTIDRGTDLSFVLTVIGEIGRALRNTPKPYTILLRSTVPPGTTRDRVVPELRTASGRAAGEGVQLFYNPEFLRQGSAIADFRHPPFTVVGTPDEASPSAATGIDQLYGEVEAALLVLNYQEAELLKLACNSFHALKIDFANEIGSLAQRVDADPTRVMNALVEDTKLNISPAYLRPGFAFGGSCLPKDVRSLNYIAAQHHLELPIHRAILRSNDAHLERLVADLASRCNGTIGMVGLAFKPNTDDLRESPAMRLVEQLLKVGMEVVVHEPEIREDLIIGANLKYLTEVLPDYSQRLVDWATLRQRADLLLITRDGIVTPGELSKLEKPLLNLSQLGAADVAVLDR